MAPVTDGHGQAVLCQEPDIPPDGHGRNAQGFGSLGEGHLLVLGQHGQQLILSVV